MDGNAGLVTRESLVEKARAMIPDLQARAAQAEAQSRVPDETIAAFKEAGFFRVLQPKRHGGLEMDPQTFFDIQMTIGEGCMSSAWVYGVIAVHPFQLALFDDQAAQDVWGDDPDVLISSSYQPVGKVTRVDGGFRLSGHWSFSSGSQHCDWVFLGAMIPPEAEGMPPDMRTYMLPRSDYKIVENWDVIGLKGTGSHDIIVDDVFVPEYRTHRAADGFAVTSPGNAVNTSAVYRLPWAQVFVRAVSTAAIGALQGALNAFVDITKTRVSSNTGQKTIQDPDAMRAISEATRTIDELRLVLFRNFDDMMARVNAGEEISIEARVKYRYDSAVVARQCCAAVEGMQALCGGRGIFNGSPLTRYWLDLHASRGHVANEPTRYANNLGGISAGLDNADFFI